MISFSVRRPVAVFMMCLGILVLGVLSARKIPMLLMPPMDRPEFVLTTDFRGAGPEEVESQVTWPIERAIATTPGIEGTESVSVRERSEIRVKLRADVSILDTLSILREKVDSAGIPETAGKPRIDRAGSSQEPLFRIAFVQEPAAGAGEESALQFAERLQETWIRRLERVEGVALANLIGVPRRVVEIRILPAKLQAYGLTLQGIAQALAAQSKAPTAGEIEDSGRKITLKVGSPASSLEELMTAVILRDQDRAVRIGDIARAELKEVPPEETTHYDGKPSLILEIRKEAGANSVAVAQGIRRALAALEAESTQNSPRYFVLYDEGESIEAAVQNVSSSVQQGAVLAALCVYLLVQALWPTFVVTIIIPLSLFMTLIGMHFFGVSFNLMSLAGLALGVGMLVDSSMVVLESINQEALETPDRAEAALRGTQKVAGAITGSTLATMAVFAPLAFIGGTIGQVFRDVAITVSLCLAASLFVSISVVPMLSALRIDRFTFGLTNRADKTPKATPPDWEALAGTGGTSRVGWAAAIRRHALAYRLLMQELRRGFAFVSGLASAALERLWKKTLPARQSGGALIMRIFGRTTQALMGIERWVRNRIPALIDSPRRALWATLAGTAIGMLLISGLGSELFPEDDAAGWVYRLEFPSGQSARATEAKVTQLEEKLSRTGWFERVASVIGRPTGNEARILLSPREGRRSEALMQIRALMGDIPDLTATRIATSLISSDKPLRLEIFHDELEALSELSGKALSVINPIPGLVEIESDQKPPLREVEIDFKKSLLDYYELDAGQFLSPLKSLLRGESAGLFQVGGKDAELRLLPSGNPIQGVGALGEFGVGDRTRRAYLADVSSIREVRSPSLIRHIDRKRAVTISSSLSGVDMQTAGDRILTAVKKLWRGSAGGSTPASYRLGGADEERRKNQAALMGAIGLSIFLIFLLLAAQFESLVQPLIVLLTVPLCISGVAVALWCFGTPISAMVLVGFVILVGSSVNTSIVMVDFANQIRATGRNPRDSILEAAIKRLRPILITTLTNILGLLPMIASSGPGSAMQRPLALTLVGGLISSTVLCYFVIPLAYSRTRDVTGGTA